MRNRYKNLLRNKSLTFWGHHICNRISYYYVINDMSISHIYQPEAVNYMMKSMALIKPLLFENSECRQGYDFRVLAEVTEAIQYAYFSDKHKISFWEKVRGVSFAANHQMVQQALSEICMKNLPDKSWKIKAFLLKKRMSFIFVLLKSVSDVIEG